MPPEHLHGDSLRSTPSIHYWMRVRRRCGCPGRAPPRDRSATATSFALGFHVPPACFTRSRTATSAKATRNPDNLVLGEARPWRFPIAFGDEEFRGFEPLLPPRIGGHHITTFVIT